MPRTMGSEYRHGVIRIDVMVMSHFTHLNMRFTGFLVLFMRSWFPTIIRKRGCALYTKLRPIHHFKGLDKGCVLYTRNYGTSQNSLGVLKGDFGGFGRPEMPRRPDYGQVSESWCKSNYMELFWGLSTYLPQRRELLRIWHSWWDLAFLVPPPLKDPLYSPSFHPSLQSLPSSDPHTLDPASQVDDAPKIFSGWLSKLSLSFLP